MKKTDRNLAKKNRGANKGQKARLKAREVKTFSSTDATSQAQATVPQPLTAIEMEVHHHPQLSHQSKPWKEYLLEGFMIFIAVMMGFIAENIREHITNSEHIQQLTAQLVQDLESDTAQLNKIYEAETKILRCNDTLVNLLRQPLQQLNMKKVQSLITDSHSLWPFHPSRGAIAAIKNELHLKQFSNSELIGRFGTYEGHIELLQTVQGIALQYQRNFLDPFLTAHFTPANMEAAFEKSPALNSQMRNLSQAGIDQLAADMILTRINSKELVNDNRMLKRDATDLLEYVIKQYQSKENK